MIKNKKQVGDNLGLGGVRTQLRGKLAQFLKAKVSQVPEPLETVSNLDHGRSETTTNKIEDEIKHQIENLGICTNDLN